MRQEGLVELTLEEEGRRITLRFGERPPSPPPPQEPTEEEEALVIRSPVVGTFWLRPAPEEAPFVAVGQRVETGQVLGIVEAMKVMNEVRAERAGVVEEILAEEGEAVEYGQPLFRLRPE
ncbi:MAG TPA: acetyl-CoA carboxylase, biotin carboxyl carrier protein [Candidatus Acetothermia bacterium]|nr:acetyl-CoA carboxylase, biotin carboxyl carrier protein [Candidatus Acetothermia bacterium]